MNLTIQLPHVANATTARDHADRVLRFALTRFSGAISAVRLRLVDENGPRGGVDQRCRIHVVLRTGDVLRVESVGSDAYAVIHQVCTRMAHTVARRLSRLSARRLGPIPAPDETYGTDL